MAKTTSAAHPPVLDDTVGGCDVFHAHPTLIAAARERLMGQPQVVALAETFRALGDPTRVRILDALSETELCVCDIAALLGLGESAVSHQLRVLRSLRLVRARREGRMVFYTLDDEHITRLFAQGLKHVEEAWPTARFRPAMSAPADRSDQ
jgi:DNA-binding transcriptional ArsR family regulator